MRFCTGWKYVALIATITFSASAVMLPNDMQIANNALASMAFNVKDLVISVSAAKEVSGMDDIYRDLDDLSTTFLSNIPLAINSPAFVPTNTTNSALQLTYESYSNLIQSLLELCDALTSQAHILLTLDPPSIYRIPGLAKEVSGIADAWLYLVIALFPRGGPYEMQASNQKAQVDTHMRNVGHAYRLVTAKTRGAEVMGGIGMGSGNRTVAGGQDLKAR